MTSITQRFTNFRGVRLSLRPSDFFSSTGVAGSNICNDIVTVRTKSSYPKLIDQHKTSINQSIRQSINQSIYLSIKSINRTIKKTNQSINQSVRASQNGQATQGSQSVESAPYRLWFFVRLSSNISLHFRKL